MVFVRSQVPQQYRTRVGVWGSIASFVFLAAIFHDNTTASQTIDPSNDLTPEEAVNQYGGIVCDRLSKLTVTILATEMTEKSDTDMVEAYAIINASIEVHCPEER